MIITAASLQKSYNKLYTQFRNYVWEFDIIESLADLEVEIYQTFPDMGKVKSKYKKLRQEVSYTGAFQHYEELKEAFDTFEESLDEADELYVNIKSFKEVVVV